MGPLGWQETLFIFVFALLIFGPKKLPELGKTIGKAMTEFRRASSELKSTWDREMSALERENESLADTTRKIDNEISQSVYDDGSSYNYDSSYDYGYGADNTASSDQSSTVGASATQDAEQLAGTGEAQTAAPTATASAETGTESATAVAQVDAPPAAVNGATAETPGATRS